MSWDIYIQDLPDVASSADIPADFKPGPIGTRDELVRKIIEVFPGADRQDNDWLFVNTSTLDLSIQLHMEDAVSVRYVVVHVHGGEGSAAGVAALLRHLELRAMDTATGELYDGFTLDESL